MLSLSIDKKTVPELGELLRDSTKELVDLRIRKETGQLEKPHLIQEIRRDIARIETLLHEKAESILQDGDRERKNQVSLDAIARRSDVSHRKALRALAKAS